MGDFDLILDVAVICDAVACATAHGAGREAGCEGQSRAREEAGSSKRECFRSGGGAEEEGQTLEEHGRRIMAIHVHGSTSRVHGHPVPGRGPADPRPDTGCAQRAGPVHMGYSISLRH